MVEPVLGAFEEILTTWQGTRCPTCNRPTGDAGPVIQVGRIVLDRAGFGPTATMEVVATPNKYADATTDELIDQLAASIERSTRMLDAARGMRDLERAQEHAETIEGDVVEELLNEDAPLHEDEVRIPVGNGSTDERKP